MAEQLCHSRPPMSRTMKIRKLKLFYFQKNARYRAKELCRNIFLGNLSLNEGKISVGLPVLILELWWRHVKTKYYPAKSRVIWPDTRTLGRRTEGRVGKNQWIFRMIEQDNYFVIQHINNRTVLLAQKPETIFIICHFPSDTRN